MWSTYPACHKFRKEGNINTNIISCVGDVILDYFIPITPNRLTNVTNIVDDVSPDFGGPAFNVSYYLSLWGLSPNLCGFVGRNDRFRFETIANEIKLDTSNIIYSSEESDTLISIKKMYTIFVRSKIPKLEPIVSNEVYSLSKIVCLFGSRHKEMRETQVRVCKNTTCTLVFNPSYAIFNYGLRELNFIISRSTYLFLNQEEGNYIIKTFSLSDILGILKLFPQLTVVLTQGSHGVTLFQNKEIRYYPSMTNDVVNPTGAGDALIAGFLLGIIQNQSILDSLRIASACAAYATEEKTTRANIKLEKLFQRVTDFKHQESSII